MRITKTREERVDWFAVLNDLNRAGFPNSQVATATAIPRQTLCGYKDGAEPRHQDGETLLAFWMQVTGKDRAETPVISVFSFLA